MSMKEVSHSNPGIIDSAVYPEMPRQKLTKP